MFSGFLREEGAQGAIEYILLAGGIIVAAVIVLGIYSQMVQTSGKTLNITTYNATSKMSSLMQSGIADME